jgi:Protein of unknown function (DUF3788)
MKSIFIDKLKTPDDSDLKSGLKDCFRWWKELENYTLEFDALYKPLWKFASEKFGWGFQIKDKKRAIVYLLPRDKYFKVGLVFGKKAVEKIMSTNIHDSIKKLINDAPEYAEGKGIRIDVKDDSLLNDIKALIQIKIKG